MSVHVWGAVASYISEARRRCAWLRLYIMEEAGVVSVEVVQRTRARRRDTLDCSKRNSTCFQLVEERFHKGSKTTKEGDQDLYWLVTNPEQPPIELAGDWMESKFQFTICCVAEQLHIEISGSEICDTLMEMGSPCKVSRRVKTRSPGPSECTFVFSNSKQQLELKEVYMF